VSNNDALYTDSTLALDADTGKLAWHYQHMNRDVWDLDWAFEQSLITLPVNGKPTQLVVNGGKSGRKARSGQKARRPWHRWRTTSRTFS
jgi:alcohol dehydrogenase (cytochrome c)